MNNTAEFPMGMQGIGDSIAFIENVLKEHRLSKRDLMEALLLSEEAMMLLEEHAREDSTIRVTVSKRLGVPRIKIVSQGTPLMLDEHVPTTSLDQLGEDSEDAIRGIMLRSYTDSIKYRHNRAGNVVTIITGIPERLLATQTVTAIVLALVTGFIFRYTLPGASVQWLINNLFGPIETLFLSALMCITAPAVFFSITCSMFRFEGFSELGQSGKKVIASYILTSVAATLIGVCCFQLLQPGTAGAISTYVGEGSSGSFSLLIVLTTLVPHNIVEPFMDVNSIQLMVVAIFVGMALSMSGKRVIHLKTIVEELDILCGKVSSLVMKGMPIVVFCSTANVVLNARMELFVSIGQLIGVLLIGLLAMLLFYCILLVAVARLNPIIFFKKYAPTMKNTFLKGSGVAAIPMTMRVCHRKLGIPKGFCSFSIPLGATINMDGNCICLIITSMFFARICGAPMTASEIVILLFLVLILSLGAPIAPGTLILCLITLLTQMGITTSVISLIIGINFVLEMLLGMANCVGDVVIALTIARREGTLDIDTYRR